MNSGTSKLSFIHLPSSNVVKCLRQNKNKRACINVVIGKYIIESKTF